MYQNKFNLRSVGFISAARDRESSSIHTNPLPGPLFLLNLIYLNVSKLVFFIKYFLYEYKIADSAANSMRSLCSDHKLTDLATNSNVFFLS